MTREFVDSAVVAELPPDPNGTSDPNKKEQLYGR